MKRESRRQEFVWGFQYSLPGSKTHHLSQEKSNSLRGSTEVVNIHYLGQIQNLGQNKYNETNMENPESGVDECSYLNIESAL